MSKTVKEDEDMSIDGEMVWAKGKPYVVQHNPQGLGNQ